MKVDLISCHQDIDTIDSLLGGKCFIRMDSFRFNTLSDSIRMFANTLSTIIGAVILIAIILPWFLIAVLFVSLCYVYAGMFYRESARELKVRGHIIKRLSHVLNKLVAT